MSEPTGQHGYIHRKDDYLRRLRRIEGQARGLQRMVDEEQYCIDILTQVSAMTKALHSVALGLLDEHLSHCVVDAAKAGGRAKEAGGDIVMELVDQDYGSREFSVRDPEGQHLELRNLRAAVELCPVRTAAQLDPSRSHHLCLSETGACERPEPSRAGAGHRLDSVVSEHVWGSRGAPVGRCARAHGV